MLEEEIENGFESKIKKFKLLINNHLHTLLVFLLEETTFFLFMDSIASSYKMLNFPTLLAWHVFAPNLLYYSPQSSGTTISNTSFSKPILSL